MSFTPCVQRLAHTVAALAIAGLSFAAAPASAQTGTIGDGAAVGASTRCPGEGAAVIDAFTLSAATPDTVQKVRLTLSPASAYLGLDRVEIQTDGGATLGTVIPTSSDVEVPLSAPLSVGTTPVQYRVAVTPKTQAAMPAGGTLLTVRARVYYVMCPIGSPNVWTSLDKAGATLTIDNQPPSNVLWTSVTSTASAIDMSWAGTPDVLVLRRMGGAVTEAPADGQTYSGSLGESSVLVSGPAPGLNDGGVTTGSPYYYRVFVRDSCGNWSTGSALGPIVPGGAAEGDPTPGARTPVVGILNPTPGPVTPPFRVQVRVFSPTTSGGATQAITAGSVKLTYDNGTTSNTVTLVQNPNYGTATDSGVFESAPIGTGLTLPQGRYTIRAEAANAAGTVRSGAIGIVVNAGKGDGHLLVRDNSSQLCTDCHALKTHSSEATGVKYGSWSVACRQCHQPHNTTNASLVADEITPPAVNGVYGPKRVYFGGATGGYAASGGASNPAAATYANGDGTGPCQVCHTRTAYYTRDGLGVDHNPGTRCGDCHMHAQGMAASCSGCHGTPGRVGITGADALVAAAPPVGAHPGETLESQPHVGDHLAHVNQATYREMPLACANCHAIPNQHDGSQDVLPFNGLASTGTTALFNGATCSTYCHGATLSGGSNSTPGWATGDTLDCGSCHGNPPPAPHVSRSDCGTCHGAGYTNAVVAKATHIDGTLDIGSMACSGCHGNVDRLPVASATLTDVNGDNLVKAAPPVDAAGLSGTSQVGAHQQHVNQGATTPALSNALTCSLCHAVPTSGTASGTHRDGTSTVAFSSFANATGAGYNNATHQCSSTYCHGNFAGGNGGGLISWGTGTLGKLSCTACHPNSPGYPHPGDQTCADCHPGYSKTGAATGTVDAAKHVDGAVTKSSNSCTSCHGDLAQAAGVATIASPTLAAPGVNAAATSKDTVGNIATTVNGVGAHRAHLFKTNMRQNPLACTECHALPESNADTSHATGAGTGGARATLTFGALANGQVDAWSGTVSPIFAGSTSASGGTSGGTCASTYCHGAFKNGKNATPSWPGDYGLTASSLDCNSCHGRGTGATATPPVDPHPNNANCGLCHTNYTATSVDKAVHVDGKLDVKPMTCSGCHGQVDRQPVASATALDFQNQNLVKAAPPLDASGLSGTTQVGAHQAHVNQGATSPPLSNALACMNCHVVPASTSHSDGDPLVTFGGLAKTRGATGATIDGTNTCSSTYCHGAFTYGNGANPISWGTGTPNKQGCASCHPNSPAHPHPGNQACADCHPGGYSKTGATTGTVAAATHVDGLTTKSTNSCTSCHGDLSQAAGVATLASPALAAPGANAAATSKDTMGGTSTLVNSVGAHRAHLFKTNQRLAALACTECHALPPSDADRNHANDAGTGGARASVPFPGTLAKGQIDPWSGAVIPAYVESTSGTGGTTGGACSNTYCHGNFKNGKNAKPSWPGTYGSALTASTLDCNSCHGRGTGATATPPGGTHLNRSDCASCHPDYTVAANRGTHVDGRLDLVGMTCASCHGTNRSPNTGIAGTTDPNLSAAPPVDTTGSSTTPAVGPHQGHVNPLAASQIYAPIACSECHSTAVNTYGLAHSNATVDVIWTDATGANLGGITPSWTDGSPDPRVNPGSCVTYCHGATFTTAFQGTLTKTGWNWNTGITADCGSCHGLPPDSGPGGSHEGVAAAATSCNACHPDTVDTSGRIIFNGGVTLHINGQLDGGISIGGMPCTQCHNSIYLAMTSATHRHAISATGKDLAPNTGTYPNTTNAQACVQCHMDHNAFNGAKASNLRSSATTQTPTATNTDHDAGTGVCVSCHGTGSFTKSSGGTTPTVNGTSYTASAHDYGTDPTSTFKGPTTFSANCSKCHNNPPSSNIQSSTDKFALHDSTQASLLAPLGSAAASPLEEGFCYRCHSNAADAIGGTRKPAANNDWYGSVTTMTAASQDLYVAMQKGNPGSPASTVSGTSLFFRADEPTGGGLPTAYVLASGTYTGDSTLRQYSMFPGSAGSAQTSYTSSMTSTTGTRYARMMQFISPPVATGGTISTTASLTLVIRTAESVSTMNAVVRYAVYRLTSAGTVGTTIVAGTNAGGELGNGVANSPYTQTITITPTTAATLAANERIMIELEVFRNSTASGTATYYWNGTEQARLVLPVSMSFTIPAVAGYGRHNVGAYSGLHKPNPADETKAWISANKHVECADCHSPHDASAATPHVHPESATAPGGTKTATNNQIGSVLKGASGVTATFVTGTNWPATTAITYSEPAALTATTDKEYQICFKCHSGANSQLASWNSGWTDVGRDFNPGNLSYHPIVQALPQTNTSTTLGSVRLAGRTMVNGWALGATMWCTDCHGGETTNASFGPHGSAIPYMLRGGYWPKNSTGAYITLSGTTMPPGTLCANCHGALSNTTHGRSNHYEACLYCHIAIPHGGKAPRLLAAKGTTAAGCGNVPVPYCDPASPPGLTRYSRLSTGNAASSGQCSSECAHSGGTESW